MYPSQTDLTIEDAARKARELALADFAAGKSYVNPYSKNDVIHFAYSNGWLEAELRAAGKWGS